MAAPRNPFSDIPELDPSRAAVDHLNTIIDRGETHEDIVILDENIQAREAERRDTEEVRMEGALEVPEVEVLSADDARRGARVLETVSERDSVRLLLFTKNVALRQLGSLPQKRLLELSRIFAEIHVVILNEAIEETVSTVRLADNVWLYSTDSTRWWKVGFDAFRMANEQLVFAGGFRADVVVAEDPFESGAAAYAIARKFDRPFQVHILEDIYAPEWGEHDEHHWWRALLAHYIVKRSDCARVATEVIREKLVAKFPDHGPYTEVLPIYYNLEAWRDMTPTDDLRLRYPQFKFIILHISGMSARSHTVEVLHGTAPLLRMYPTIGLVIVGNGPYRPALEKQAIALGVSSQVEFEPTPDEVISLMKSANVLVHLSEDPEEDTVVLEAATVKLPMIASSANIAGTLFRDNESAFICNGADPACVSHRLRAFLNDNRIRTQFGLNAQEIVFQRIEQDYNAYLLAYRSSIERCA